MYPHYAVSDLAQSPHLLMLTTSTGTTPAQPDSGLPYWTAHDTITGHSTIRVNEIEPQPCFSYSLPVSVSSVQFSSVAQLCPTLFDPMNRSTPGLPVHHQLPEFTQTHVLRVSDAIQPSHPLLSPLLLPSIFPSIRVFSNELALHIRWPKYWSFNFNISPSNEHPGLISFRMDWLDLLLLQWF